MDKQEINSGTIESTSATNPQKEDSPDANLPLNNEPETAIKPELTPEEIQARNERRRQRRLAAAEKQDVSEETKRDEP